MKLVTFDAGRGPRLGAMVPSGVFDLSDAASDQGASLPASMQDLIEQGRHYWRIARDVIAKQGKKNNLSIEAVRLLSPLPRPVRLRDASLFLEHMEAALIKLGRKMDPQFKEQVIYYNADHVHVFGTGTEITWPTASTWIDYELEWACVIGVPGADISRDDASGHIFGFTIFNDWSARDLQFPFMNAGLGPGAGKDFANTLGPCIVTTDEFADPYALRMSAHVNGELWSSGTTASMYWRFEDAVAQLSRDRPLIAGEIIGSGTVLDGCGFELERRLAFGDMVELEVEGIGVLANRIAQPFSKSRILA